MRFKLHSGYIIITSLILLFTNHAVAAMQTISTSTSSTHTIVSGDGVLITASGSIIDPSIADPNVNALGDGISLPSSVSATSITNEGTINAGEGSAIRLVGNSTLSGAITNNGTMIGSDDPVMRISDGITVTGGIINNGTISGAEISLVGANGNPVTIQSGFNNTGTISGSSRSFYSKQLNLTGGLSNSGSMSSTGRLVFYFAEASIIDAFSNSGTLLASDPTGEMVIYLDTDSSIQGDFINSGAIKSSADNAIQFTNGNLSLASLGGDFINQSSGLIEAGSGYGVRFWTNSGLAGNFDNAGIIKATGEALYFNSTTVGGNVTNSGTLFSSTSSSIKSSSSTITGGVTNTTSGKLIGDLDGTMDIVNNGGIYLKIGSTFGSQSSTGNAVGAAITGDYTQSNTGLLHLAVDSNATAGTSYSQFSATGTVTLSANANIDIDVLNNGTNLNDNDVVQNVITAGSLSASTFNVTDNSLAWRFTAADNGSNGVDLTAIATGMTTLEGTGGGDAGAVLDTILPTATGDLSKAADALYAMNSSADVVAAIDQTRPLLEGGMAAANLQSSRAINNHVSARMDNLIGISAEGATTNDAYWIQPLSTQVNQKDTNGAYGYKANTWGFVTGADKTLRSGEKMGVAFAYSDSGIKGNSSAMVHAADIKKYQFIGYGSQNLNDDLDMFYQVDYSYNTNKGQRTIDFGSLDRTALSSYRSESTHAGMGLRRLYESTGSTSYLTSVQLDYTHLNEAGYAETGAGDLNLTVDKKSFTEMTLMATGKASKSLENGILNTHIGIGYDLHADTNSITAAYTGGGNSFVTSGVANASLLFTGGVNYNQSLSETVNLQLAYDIESRKGLTNQTASLSISGDF